MHEFPSFFQAAAIVVNQWENSDFDTSRKNSLEFFLKTGSNPFSKKRR
ncbi:hypothetical protein LEP1GSC060_2008 [Leptospira weilii serovar Ranarum str. ICFT]|uniref:Uncharacterized protein n=1 Tax=Leptospira weilii serovar Ranarum str. ICFT TaxID=1218598 RepID=N1WMU2_9LEPT|nr:hypothetical protein LEP1GSC060_2008 [Leptospira weilii serovar Ranarum str. ICFT]